MYVSATISFPLDNSNRPYWFQLWKRANDKFFGPYLSAICWKADFDGGCFEETVEALVTFAWLAVRVRGRRSGSLGPFSALWKRKYGEICRIISFIFYSATCDELDSAAIDWGSMLTRVAQICNKFITKAYHIELTICRPLKKKRWGDLTVSFIFYLIVLCNLYQHSNFKCYIIQWN